MGALGLGGVVAPLAYKGTLDGGFFAGYVGEHLAPAMREGDSLILDNLSAHKVKGALKPLAGKGVNAVFLPVYSQDFNPIEHTWSKVKACLRKLKARTAGELVPAMVVALDSITLEDCKGWIRHCGYRLQ